MVDPSRQASWPRALGLSTGFRRLAGALVIGWALAGCAFTFGEGPEPDNRSPQERRQDASRRYLQELERTERQRQFFDPIPTDR